MNKIAILVKTYLGDIKYVERLIRSYNKYNKDNISLYIIAPKSDLEIFKKFECKNIKLLSDQLITKHLVTDDSVRGIRPGYINQEIIKLAFWETKLCENYFCMDSDGVFIRDFFIGDFMYDNETPYTILVEDNELKVDPEYYKANWAGREKLIRLIQKEIGLIDRRMLTCHSFAIFSCKVLKSFYHNYLIPKNKTYIDLMKIAPYEFSWYNMWLQKDKTIKIEFREPLIKMFHQKSHHLDYLNRGVELKDIARGYIGYSINSNYSRDYGIVSYKDGHMYQSLSENIISLSKLRKFVSINWIHRKLINKRITILFKRIFAYISILAIVIDLRKIVQYIFHVFKNLNRNVLGRFSLNNLINLRRIKLSESLLKLMDNTVHYGKFKGLLLNDKYEWNRADVGNMLLGLYEKEVTESLSSVPPSHKTLVDLGSADGYFAIGCLVAKMFDKVYCFETSFKRQKILINNALLNHVEDRVEVYGTATNKFPFELQKKGVDISKCVIISDIEGGEFEVFDKIVLEALKESITIIEIHEWHKNGINRYRRLQKRAKKHFAITKLTTRGRDLSIFPEIAELADNDRWLLCSEGRHHLTTWIRLDPKNN